MKLFYEKPVVTVFKTVQPQDFLIMKNVNQTTGLFPGIFKENIFILNIGWNSAEDL